MGVTVGRYTSGWIKIQRKAVLGDIGSSFTRSGLFSALVAIANQKESIVSWKNKPVTLKRGQLVTSLKELSSIGACDSRTINKHLHYLELRGTVVVEKSYGGLLIKFVNFEKHNRLNAEGSEFNVDSDDKLDAELMLNPMREPYIHNEEIKEYKNVVVGMSSSERFEYSQKPEAGVLKTFFNDNKISQLEKYIPEILKYFVNVESFDNWYQGLVKSKTFPKDQDFSNQTRYVVGSLKRELGLIPSEATSA